MECLYFGMDLCVEKLILPGVKVKVKGFFLLFFSMLVTLFIYSSIHPSTSLYTEGKC